MELRIYRTYQWELAVPISQARLGGDNPMKITAIDELQFFESESGKWIPVPVLSEPVPTHPREIQRQREEQERGEKLSMLMEEMTRPGPINVQSIVEAKERTDKTSPQTPALFPVLGYPYQIPWEIAKAANDNAIKMGHEAAPLHKIVASGGYGTDAMDEFLPNWKERFIQSLQWEIANLARQIKDWNDLGKRYTEQAHTAKREIEFLKRNMEHQIHLTQLRENERNRARKEADRYRETLERLRDIFNFHENDNLLNFVMEALEDGEKIQEGGASEETL